MNSKELRIGNLFNEKFTNTIIEVESVSKNAITFSGYFKNDWQAEPIPLTKEWLEKFDQSNPHIIQRIINEIDESYFEIELFIGGKYYNSKIYYELQYVHQLQNLYYALTGIELTYEILT